MAFAFPAFFPTSSAVTLSSAFNPLQEAGLAFTF
jgi:hypothetical protein